VLNLKVLLFVKPPLLEINVFPELAEWPSKKEGHWGKSWFWCCQPLAAGFSEVSALALSSLIKTGIGAHTQDKSVSTSWISNLYFTVLIYTPIFQW